MSASLELLILEFWVSAQLLQASFWSQCERSVTCSMMWCRTTKKWPYSTRERDQWPIQIFAAAGFSKDNLDRINRVRLHKQALFLLCVLRVPGKLLSPKYMTERREDDK